MVKQKYFFILIYLKNSFDLLAVISSEQNVCFLVFSIESFFKYKLFLKADIPKALKIKPQTILNL